MTEKPKRDFSEWYWLLGIFFLGLILRLIYLFEVRHCPLLTDPGLDLQAYDLWAQRIARGDWLGDKVFYQSPLYPYFLAIFYALFARRLFLIYLVQIILGALDCLLLYGIGKNVFARRAGLIAGFLGAIYGPLIFYQALLIKTFLGIFLFDLSLYLLVLSFRSPSWVKGFFSGILLGLASLVRDNYLLGLFWFFPWLYFRFGKTGQSRKSSGFALGVILIIALCGLRNWVVGRDFVLTTSQAGQNFYIGNHRGNLTGSYYAPDFVRANPFFEEDDFRREAEKRLGRKDLKPSEISRFWFKEAFKEIKAEPGLFFQRLGLKLILFWNRKEIADNVSIYLFRREFSFLLRFLPDFGWLGGLALLGLTIGLYRRKGLVLGGFLIIYWLSISAFYIFSRYRLGIISLILLFAGLGLEFLWQEFQGKNWRNLAIALGITAMFYLLVWAPLVKETLDYAYYNLGNAYARSGDYKKAIESYQKAIKENPQVAKFWVNLGIASERVGDYALSFSAYLRALELEPNNPRANLGLGKIFYMRGAFEQAETHLKKALELEPELKEARIYLDLTRSRLEKK